MGSVLFFPNTVGMCFIPGCSKPVCGDVLLTSKMGLKSSPHSSQVYRLLWPWERDISLIPPPKEKFCTSSAQRGRSYLFILPQFAQCLATTGKCSGDLEGLG